MGADNTLDCQWCWSPGTDHRPAATSGSTCTPIVDLVLAGAGASGWAGHREERLFSPSKAQISHRQGSTDDREGEHSDSCVPIPRSGTAPLRRCSALGPRASPAVRRTCTSRVADARGDLGGLFMGENGTPENVADRLTRRRFVRFSGLAGASVVLAAAGQDLAAADEPTPPPPTVGGPDPTVCGSTSSTDPLWVSMQRCHSNNSCLQNGNDYVVMPGNNNASGYTNYILVPTQRINGSSAPGSATATPLTTGTPRTISPRGRRPWCGHRWGWGSTRSAPGTQPAPHPHGHRTAGVRNDLESQQGNAAHNVVDRAHTRVSVRGFSEQLGVLPHVYRVLIWPGFSHDNLFDMLRTMLVHALGQGATVADAQDQMRFQTLIVIPRTSGGYFIVNSESQLRDPNNHQLVGTNTCDPLLLLHP